MIFYLIRYYLESKLFTFMPEKWVKKMHLKRFRKIFEWARENSAFYKKVYEGAGVLNLKIKSEEDIKKVPVVDKKMMRSYALESLCTCEYKDTFVESKTSGSNGIPFEIYATRKEHFTSYVRTFFAISGYNPFSSFILVGTTELKEEAEKLSFLHYLQKYLGLFRRQTISVLLPPVEIIENLKGKRISVLSSTPSCISVLIDTIKKTGDKLSIKYVVLSGEVISEPLRKDIQTYFRAKIINVYGCVEHPSLAWTKPNGRTYKYALNAVMFEYINNLEINGSNYGELLFTNLINRTMPFIRYKIGDHVELQNSYNKMGKIEGRADDIIDLEDGRKMFMYQMDQFMELEGILQYKILQTTDSKLHFQVVCVEGYNISEMIENIKSTWIELFGDYPVSIELRKELPVNPNSGKFKRMEVEI
ncbi:MAG: phenylacetate--CoA ligase family protein [Bacteroidetes bacterium]|nr:phenylacetate--CoA ligase family protein [Bacteroidota bacterium]